MADTGAVFASWSDGLTSAARTDSNVQADLEVTARFTSLGSVDIDWYGDNGFAPASGQTWADLDNVIPPGKSRPLKDDFIALTDPNVPTSVFRVVGIVLGPPPLVVVEPSSMLRRYTLQYAHSLAPEAWMDLGDQVRVPGGGPLTGIASETPVFYRVDVELP